MPKVINLKEAATQKCNCENWVDHWKKHSKNKIAICSSVGCYNTDVTGAHVKKIDSDHDSYIIPLCEPCNDRTEEFNVGFLTEFAPIGVAESCGG